MEINVNGDIKSINSGTLADVLIELGYVDQVIATALNGIFVPVSMRENTSINQHDTIEILAPMQGG